VRGPEVVIRAHPWSEDDEGFCGKALGPGTGSATDAERKFFFKQKYRNCSRGASQQPRDGIDYLYNLFKTIAESSYYNPKPNY